MRQNLKIKVKRFLRDLLITFMYKLEKSEKKSSDGEINIDYSLHSRWASVKENKKSIAFGLTSLRDLSRQGEIMLWVDQLEVFRDKDKGTGIGSYLIRQIIRDAEKLKVPVSLFVQPRGVKFEKEELTQWYARYGFKKEGGAMGKR
ncbi:hypothetical protein [Tolypothrix sp. VBCCA 56010]|uniref:hypothetical protein n=1 Tax=Tolypothrix sp. VBCCA 56010 TaxID=3137731 RepID=UPI003D7D7F3C